MNKINVLDDKGYVILHEIMGSDLTVANAARVSYDKRTEKLTEGDKRLIKFLAREGHSSPFRHATLQFEVYAPLMVARQWWKYIVGSDHVMDSWNESSRRYITEEPAFYIPKANEWRSAPANSKQGSGVPIPATKDAWEQGFGGNEYTRQLEKFIAKGEELYDLALAEGICAEQARLFLPAYGMFVRWTWTASLQSVAHFLNQRLAHDSQVEIQAYAKAVLELAKPHFPVSIGELVNGGDE